MGECDVGDNVGELVGEIVGNAVGYVVGDDVGDADVVGASVGPHVPGEQWHSVAPAR